MKLSKANKSDWGLIPSGALNKFFGEFDKFFDGFWSDSSLHNFWKETYPVNILLERAEDGSKYTASVVEVALAGVDKSRVKVSVSPSKGVNYLTIKVEKQEETRDEVYRGLTQKQWLTSYALSEIHDETKIESELVNGLLKIKVPLKEVKALPEPQEVEIPIK